MRLFTELVFDQVVRGTNEVVSPPQFNDNLGRACTVVYEIEVEEAGAASGTPTITVRHKTSCSGKGFIGAPPLIESFSLASLPYREIKVQIGPLGGLGQVSVVLGGSSPWARVRIWATGWSQ